MITKAIGEMNVRIELVVDKYCLSMDLCHSMIFSLEKEFANIEIIMSTVEPDSSVLKNMGIQILPVWILNDHVISMNPYNFRAIKALVYECLGSSGNK